MSRNRGPFPWLCVVIVLALPLEALAQKVSLGPELQANTFTSNAQRLPSVAADADGDFVVVWISYDQDGHLDGVFGARFSSAGARLATEFQVNTYTSSGQVLPQVAADSDGDFVVVWGSNGSFAAAPQDGASGGVFARRFSSTGNPLAGEFQVNVITIHDEHIPAVAMEANGDFVIAWQDRDRDGGEEGIFARLFSSAGVALASEFQVNSHTLNDQSYPSVGADLDGDFVVVWQDRYHDSSQTGIFARRFSSEGVPMATEFQVNTYSTNHQRNPAVAVSPAGDFVVTWVSAYQGTGGVFAQRFSAAGTPAGVEFKVGSGVNPAAGIDSEGDFVVTWDSSSPNEVMGLRFSSAGTALGTEFRVNTYDPGTQSDSSLAMDADGDFVIAWQDAGRDGSSAGVFVQRFGSSPLDVDANGSTDALFDGLLVLRFRFGFTADALIDGAVDTLGCTRCDAPAIAQYLSDLGLLLDIDGNGDLRALTDGLLVVRFLLGLTAEALTAGAVDTGCTRCDASTIEPYLQGLT